MIDNIIFDIGETVLIGMKGIEKKITPAFNIKEDEVLSKYLGGEKLQSLFKGKIKEDEYWRRVVKENNLPEYVEKNGSSISFLKTAMRENFAEVPGMRDILIELKKKGYVLSCFSDHVKEWVTNCELRFPFKGLFHHTYFSYDLKQTKKDPQTYLNVLKNLNADPSRTLFVDDKLRNIKIAESNNVNIRYVHLFKGADNLRNHLVEYGIL